jgi:hypothetical protein
VVAPTGSGKTLASFLCAQERDASGAGPEPPRGRRGRELQVAFDHRNGIGGEVDAGAGSTVRPLTGGMRGVFLVGSVLVFAAGVQLFVLTSRTDKWFAWTIHPNLTAAFLGGLLFTALTRACDRGSSPSLTTRVWQDSPVDDVDPELLRRATVFSTCSADQLSRMVAVAEVTEHAAGQELTQAGVIGHRFHLILDGAADVERAGASVATVPKGEFVGEIGLLGGGPATATVRCTEPTRCLTIRRERFWEVLEAEPAIALRILEVVCRRLSREFRQGAGANLSPD